MAHIDSDLPTGQPPSLLHTVIDNTSNWKDDETIVVDDRLETKVLPFERQGLEPPLSSPPAQINDSSKSVLVIENDKSLLRTFAKLLTHNGYAPRSARDGREGLRLYEHCGPFFSVIIDCNLPDQWADIATAIRRRHSPQRMLIAAFDYQIDDPPLRPSALSDIPILFEIKDLGKTFGELQFWATKDEVDHAYKNLTHPQLLWLQNRADWRARGLGRSARGREGSDLLQEAILGAFIGDARNGRRWYRNVDFITFLDGAVRSVANNWKNQRILELQTYSASEIAIRDSEREGNSPLDKIPSGDPSGDRCVIAKEQVERIFSMFNDDDKATLILKAWSKQMEKEEIIQEHGLTSQDFDAAVRRIRTLVRKMRNGGRANGRR
jgi:CheY-like chemotaxis protein